MTRLLLEFVGIATLALLAILGGLALLGRADPPQQLPLVKADFSTCQLHNPNGPVVPPKAELNGIRRTRSEIS